jgi:hypothetical protein
MVVLPSVIPPGPCREGRWRTRRSAVVAHGARLADGEAQGGGVPGGGAGGAWQDEGIGAGGARPGRAGNRPARGGR